MVGQVFHAVKTKRIAMLKAGWIYRRTWITSVVAIQSMRRRVRNMSVIKAVYQYSLTIEYLFSWYHETAIVFRGQQRVSDLIHWNAPVCFAIA
eukprot:scaffold2482_cov196-Alexandrium_tamarense.AAC.5